MTVRTPLFRMAGVVALALITTLPASADQHKRRAVKSTPAPPGPQAQAVLSGTVLDSVSNAPVMGVEVGATDKSARSDSEGKFSIRIVANRDVTLTFTRTGYQTLMTTVKLAADATQTFQLVSKPTVTVRTSTTTYVLDAETVEFGYIAPFSGYNKETHLNLCKAGGESFQPERADIRHITPAAQLSDAKCCPSGPVPAINVELKSGATVTAAFADACLGYKTDIIALDHTTTLPVYVHFSDVVEVTLP